MPELHPYDVIRRPVITEKSNIMQDEQNQFVFEVNPNANKLLEEQIKGEIDPISTGVYKLISIESRFQGGRFTQTLNGYKDVNSNTALLLPRILELSGA